VVEPLQFFAVLRDRKKCQLVRDDQERRDSDPALKIAQEAYEARTMQGLCEDRMDAARPQRRARALAVDHTNGHSALGQAAAHPKSVQLPTDHYSGDSPIQGAEHLVGCLRTQGHTEAIGIDQAPLCLIGAGLREARGSNPSGPLRSVLAEAYLEG
jgi:hypothetical protein